MRHRILAALASYGTDLLFVAGLFFLSWGLGWVYIPLAPMTIGAALIVLAVLGARKPKTRKAPEDE